MLLLEVHDARICQCRESWDNAGRGHRVYAASLYIITPDLMEIPL
jgi:hypothetical protein